MPSVANVYIDVWTTRADEQTVNRRLIPQPFYTLSTSPPPPPSSSLSSSESSLYDIHIMFQKALEDQFTLRYSIGLSVTHPPKVCVDVMYVTPLRQHVACKRGREGNNERQRGTGEDERGTPSLSKFWVIC